ncbi:hypothetical protein Lal_00032600 [Lupinus albus]|uniref:Putative nepenthesin n=1 Tax=Lupinus albus TaxID=3870 RepID=A0A6A4R643_LUPAL|nr:putative nepenthesin [Lupinus albus]KAF1897840.1 hypothetical protein Lal_00032600 [Lupinus albus]
MCDIVLTPMQASKSLFIAMKILLSLTPLILFQFFSLVQGLNPKCDVQDDHGSSLQVFHVLSPCSPFKPSNPLSWEDSVLHLQAKDQVRLQSLASLVDDRSIVPTAPGRKIIHSPTYMVRAKIGNPAQTLLMAIDNSNDASWIPCTGCEGCSSTLFVPHKSPTFKNISCYAAECKQIPNPTCGDSGCAFNLTYGNSSIEADLVQDTITLASDPLPDYTFACITKTNGTSTPPQGLLGLGRGPLSLLSQTQNLYKFTFSYCLPNIKSLNFSGSLTLGPSALPKDIKFTPLLKNPRRSSLYYVNLFAIRVGNITVDIPPPALAFNRTTGAGTIFDSGTVYTRLAEPVYDAVRDEFRRQVGAKDIVTSRGGFDTCYTVPIVAPTITFLFEGMNVTLPHDNALIHNDDGSITCLAMASWAPDNVNSVLNVIANLQQQNYRVLYDVPNSRIGISPELCS